MSGRGQGSVRTFAAVVCAVAVVLLGDASAASAAVPTPTVSPATGGAGQPVVSEFTSFDLADVGYEQ